MRKIPIEQREKLNETFNVLESFLSQNKWFAGNEEISIADYSILPTVSTIKVKKNSTLFLKVSNFIEMIFFVVFFNKELGYDLCRHPQLNEWYIRCQSLPGFDENLQGARDLAQRMFAIIDDKL